MSQKATLFNDKTALEMMILKEENQKKTESHWQKDNRFQPTWHKNAKALCFPGIEAKILQNSIC